MARSSRRAFLGQLGAAAAVIPGFGALGWEAGAAQQDPASGAVFDLLIARGRVIDPAQNLSAVRDVAIRHGRIARIDANIPPDQARDVNDSYEFIRRFIDALRVVRGNARDLTIPSPDSREFLYLAQRLRFRSPRQLEDAIGVHMGFAGSLFNGGRSTAVQAT